MISRSVGYIRIAVSCNLPSVPIALCHRKTTASILPWPVVRSFFFASFHPPTNSTFIHSSSLSTPYSPFFNIFSDYRVLIRFFSSKSHDYLMPFWWLISAVIPVEIVCNLVSSRGKKGDCTESSFAFLLELVTKNARDGFFLAKPHRHISPLTSNILLGNQPKLTVSWCVIGGLMGSASAVVCGLHLTVQKYRT